MQESDGLEITYKSNKIKKVCADTKVAKKTYGTKMAEKIDMRISEISAADTIEMMRIIEFLNQIDTHIG